MSTPTRADPLATLDLRSGIYQDSDRTFISTSTVAARGTIQDRVTVQARYLADVISSASIDVVSAASFKPFFEIRHEATGGLSYHDGTTTLGATYIHSVENDWASHTGTVAASRDLAHHNLTLAIAGTFVSNAVARFDDATFRKRLLSGGGTLSALVTLTPRDLLGLSYTGGYLSGYQASPYRFVYFTGPSGRLSRPETDPDTRLRHAVTLRFHHHAFSDSALQLHARGYGDDWGVLSLTAGVDYLIGFGDLTLALHLRGYAQQKAAFYQPTYAAPQLYMTADRELATFVDAFGGLRATWRKARPGPFEELRVEAKVDAFVFYFFDFPRLQTRDGLVAEIALGVSL